MREQIARIQYHIFHGILYFAGWSTICTAAYILFVAWQGWSSETDTAKRLEAVYWAFDGGPEAAVWVAVGVILTAVAAAVAVMVLLSLLRGLLWLMGFRAEE